MNDQDYIRKAVELADGWIACDDFFMLPNLSEIRYDGLRSHVSDGYVQEALEQIHKDALAAQLVRQMDATEYRVLTDDDETTIHYKEESEYRFASYGPDRTMNTIKAIVNSKVLAS